VKGRYGSTSWPLKKKTLSRPGGLRKGNTLVKRKVTSASGRSVCSGGGEDQGEGRVSHLGGITSGSRFNSDLWGILNYMGYSGGRPNEDQRGLHRRDTCNFREANNTRERI